MILSCANNFKNFLAVVKSLRLSGIAAVLGMCLIFGDAGSCQDDEKDWRRVTAADHILEISPSSLRLESGRIISARFRTIYDKAESLQNDPKIKYKSRVETMEFNMATGSYRSSEISLLDSKGKVVETTAGGPARKWIPGRGSTRWLSAIESVRPFGGWTINSYKLVDETTKGGFTSEELDRLVGSYVRVEIDSVQVGNNRRCQNPAYESKKMIDANLRALLGTSADALGAEVGDTDVIVMKCEARNWPPGQSLLLPRGENRMLMLWEGVFLELVYDKPKQFRLPITIQDIREKSIIVTSPE